MPNKRKPKNLQESLSLEYWRRCKPFTAMRVLIDAGYTQPERLEFLRDVVGLDYAGCVMYSYYQVEI